MIPRTADGVAEELHEAWARNDWDRAAVLERELNTYDSPGHPVPVLGAALWYAQHGLPVFPLQPLAKVPYPRTRGCLDATTDPERITAWWGRHPTSNLGIATGYRLDVIDFDGGHGHALWSSRIREHRGWPPDHDVTWEDSGVQVLATVSTPRPGGLHVYTRATGEPNGAGLVPGVDYRGRGGYVLAPPSVLDDRPGQHPGTYRFIRPLDPEQL